MIPCILIGYPDDFRGWKFWDPATKRLFVSEHSEFDEWYFPLLKLNDSVPQLVALSPSSPMPKDDGPTFPSLDAQPSTGDAPELPLQPVKQVRFSPPSPSVSPAPLSPPLRASVPISPTPSPDPLDVISPPAPPHRSGRAAEPRRDWRESVALMTPSASSPSPAPKEC